MRCSGNGKVQAFISICSGTVRSKCVDCISARSIGYRRDRAGDDLSHRTCSGRDAVRIIYCDCCSCASRTGKYSIVISVCESRKIEDLVHKLIHFERRSLRTERVNRASASAICNRGYRNRSRCCSRPGAGIVTNTYELVWTGICNCRRYITHSGTEETYVQRLLCV